MIQHAFKHVRILNMVSSVCLPTVGWRNPYGGLCSFHHETMFGVSGAWAPTTYQLYVCMHVCMCMYVCMYACMYVCMYVCMSVCMYVCTSMCVCMYVRRFHASQLVVCTINQSHTSYRLHPSTYEQLPRMR
jgi:hypothetical protein